jgi:spore coat protein U-like protein
MRSFPYRWIITLGYVALLLIVPAGANAQTCTVSMPAMAFGTNINVLPGTAIDTTTTLTVTCSAGTGQGQRVCISIGAGSANDATSRQMTGPGGSLARYDFYSDSGRSILWGSWQTGYDTAGVQLDVAKNSTTNVTVYGRFLAGQQTLLPGSYSATFSANPQIQYGNRGSTACPTGGATASTSTSATATLTNNCSVSATNINFGSIGYLVANNDAQGTVTIKCSSTLPYTVSLDGGASGATNPTQRKMSFSGSDVTYGIYRDAARSLPWGNSTGTNTASGTGSGASQSFTTYGRIAPQTTPRPGAYTDSIIATVSY